MSAFRGGKAGVVGKVAGLAEYLPVPGHAVEFGLFEGWLSDGLEWAFAHAGPGFPSAFAGGALQGFVFRGSGTDPGAVLCGALAPSFDSAGRQFPLALASPLQLAPELVARPELLPLALEGLWVLAARALPELRASSGQLPLPALEVAEAVKVDEAAELYSRWVRELPLAELWSLLGPALADPASVLRLVLQTTAFVRGQERPDTPLSLRVPLGLAGGPALCFWLGLVRESAGFRATVPSLFWSHDGQIGAALVHLGRPPRDALAELWLPTRLRDSIVDVTSGVDPGQVEACAGLPPSIARVLASRDASVQDLLASLDA